MILISYSGKLHFSSLINLTKIIGKTKADIDRTPIDFYSIGHIIFGHICYLIVFIVGYFALPYPYIMRYAMMVTFIFGAGWELLENNALLNTRIKFEGRKDSLNNSVCDILFVAGGAIIGQACVNELYEKGFLLAFILLTFFLLVAEWLIFHILQSKVLHKNE